MGRKVNKIGEEFRIDQDLLQIQKENEILKERNRDLKCQNLYLQRELERANKLAITDPLTGLNNRRGWEQSIKKISENVGRATENSKNYITIVFSDLNDLKKINERSYNEGDEYIYAMADLLRMVFTRKTDYVARLGGDEFGVLSISSKSFENIIVKRLNKIKQNHRFKDLRFCMSILSFKIEDILSEVMTVVDTNKRNHEEIIESKIEEKIRRVEESLRRVKDEAEISSKDGRKPTIMTKVS